MHGTIKAIVSQPANSEAYSRGEIRIGNRAEEGTAQRKPNVHTILTPPIFEGALHTTTAGGITPDTLRI